MMKKDLSKKVTLSLLVGSMLFANSYALAADGGEKQSGNSIVITSDNVGEYDDAAEINAGKSSTGNLESNSIDITGNSADDRINLNANLVSGGYADSYSGAALNNTVTINNVKFIDVSSETFDIYGGLTDAGAVTGNNVSITNVEIANMKSTFIAAGANGIDGGDGSTSVGEVSNNTLTINGTLEGANLHLYGGYVDNANGNATENHVIIGTAGADRTIITDRIQNANKEDINAVYGGYSEGTGNASGNRVDITNADVKINRITGGYSLKGNANSNIVTINDATTTAENIYGGHAENGSAKSNHISVEGDNTVLNNVYAGKTGAGNAESNTIKINGGSVHDAYAAVTDGGDAIGNIATMTGGKAEYLAGAATDYGDNENANGSAINNGVIMSGGEVKEVAGGEAFEAGAEVKGNYVEMSGGTAQNVYGANTMYATATGNRVTISGDAVVTGSGDNGYEDFDGSVTKNFGVYGAHSGMNGSGENTGLGALSDNTVIIKDNAQVSNAYGAYSYGDSEVSGNKVEITGNVTVGQVNGVVNEESGNVVGGYSAAGSVDSNEVTIGGESGTLTVDAEFIAGGYSGSNTATNNTVSLKDVTFKHNTEIYGGYSDSGDVSGNNVAISGKIEGENGAVVDIYAGHSENGIADGNKITLNAGADVSKANLHGAVNVGTNNELVIGEGVGNNSWSGTVNSISNFSRIAFNNVKWQANGTVLTIADTATSNLTGTVVDADGVNFDATSDVNVGESMTFVAAANGQKPVEGVSYEFGKYTVGTMYEGNLSGDAKTGVAAIETKEVASQNNLLAENRAVAAAFVNQGSDLISDSLDTLSRDGNYGVKTFAAVYGNRSKYDVNSDIKINGWSVIAGVGSEKELQNGDLSWGVFYENGSGNYRTYNEFNNEFFRGDGSVVYNGGGIAARYEQDNGVYTEASLRAGMLKSEMDNALKDGSGNSYGYDSDTAYYGAHIGIGKVISLTESTDLDVYGKFFHTYNEGDSITIGNGNEYEFDSITSDRLRVGARITTNKENKFSTYYGLAYEYEFNGDADMRVGNMRAETQSLQGSSYMAEIGLNYQPSLESPWSFDLNMRGYTGERQGESFNVQATYTF